MLLLYSIQKIVVTNYVNYPSIYSYTAFQDTIFQFQISTMLDCSFYDTDTI
jgi:hypothetical protein